MKAIYQTTSSIDNNRSIIFFVCLAVFLSSFVLVVTFSGYSQGDPAEYQWAINNWSAGKLPYRDHMVEYPPYALGIFALPEIFGDSNYLLGFEFLALLVDTAIKVVLLMIGIRMWRASRSVRSFLPIFLYSSAILPLAFFYLQRFDIWPAFICICALWLFSSKKYAWSGLMLAIGIGVKLYPAIFVLPLFIIAFRQGKWKSFISGLIIGLLPIVLLSFFLPWWRFMEAQSARGLEVESLYASFLWAGKYLGLTNINWTYARAWFEVTGPLPSAMVPWARGIFAITVLGSVAFSSWIVACRKEIKNISMAQIARLLLIPLLAFIAFNYVLSPQYMIWLIAIVALASLEENICPLFAIMLAIVLTPLFFPTSEFATGLNEFQAFILILRNLLLVGAWIFLIKEAYSYIHSGLSKKIV